MHCDPSCCTFDNDKSRAWETTCMRRFCTDIGRFRPPSPPRLGCRIFYCLKQKKNVIYFVSISKFLQHFALRLTDTFGDFVLPKRQTKLYLPLVVGCTPLAKHKPPNRLLNIWLLSSVAVALLVISTPAASPSKIRFLLNTGWDCVEMSTPACALRNISFSSRIPVPKDASKNIINESQKLHNIANSI